MNMTYFLHAALALSLFYAIGCDDNQEIFFENPEKDNTIEVVHPTHRDKPYPNEESELYLNPAPLIVPRAARAADEFLEFELSQDVNFPEQGTYRSGKLAWNTYNIHEEMKTGQYYWRFRKINKKGRADGWSKTYSFTVTGEEPVFVTPDFSVVQSKLPTSYPRIFDFLEEDIVQSRPQATTYREYSDLQSRTKSAMEYTPTGNLYESAKISELEIHVCTNLSTIYLVTGDSQYKSKLLEIGRALAKQEVDDKTLLDNNFQVAKILDILGTIYDICNTELTDAEKSVIESVLVRGVNSYYDSFRGRMETMLFDEHPWQITLCSMIKNSYLICQKYPEMMTAFRYFYELWTSRAPASGFNRDGAWFNGASYMGVNFTTLTYVPMLYSYISGTDFFKHPWYQNVGRALVYSWLPETRPTSFGDMTEAEGTPHRYRAAFADIIARETGDHFAEWYVKECGDVIYGDQSLGRLYRFAKGGPTYTKPDLSGQFDNFIWYKDCGEGVAFSNMSDRRDNLSLAFRSSPFGSGNHTHSDQNSFRLLYRGEYVYMNVGYYDDEGNNYHSKHNLLQYRGTRGHNTMLVNGIGQAISTKAYGNITRGLNGDNLAYFLGDASQAYSGISDNSEWVKAFADAGISQTPQYGYGKTPLNCYKRQIFMLRPNKIVIYDELAADEAATWQWLLHSPFEFHIAGNKVTTKYEYEGEKNFYSVAQIFSDQAVDIKATNKWFPGGEPVDHPKDGPYKKQWHLTADFNEKSLQNKILTVIQVTDDGHVDNIWRVDDNFTFGNWNIEAELSPEKPAAISITNKVTGTMFSNTAEAPVIEGTPYQRRYESSSILYDNVHGVKQVQEVGDKQVQVTRSVK